MAKAKNETGAPVSASVAGKWYHVADGESVTADPRTILSLGEYGLTVVDRDQVIEADEAPITDGETNHTGGRQNRSDDPRANTPGTPVTVTGDTGSTIVAPAVQGQTSEAAAAGAPNEVLGVEDLRGQALTDALVEAGLAKGGTVEEKRARLAEHRESLSEAQPDEAALEQEVAELIAFAEVNGLDLEGATTREAILEVIEKARAEDTPTGDVTGPDA